MSRNKSENLSMCNSQIKPNVNYAYGTMGIRIMILVNRRITSLITAAMLLAALPWTSCMKWEYGIDEPVSVPDHGLFIACEGNFQYGNSSLSFYDPADRNTENELFYRANAMKLGDVAQSLALYDGQLWITVNNSHVIFAVDATTLKEQGRITDLSSPRFIHFISPDKAYVTQLWDNRIYIINPRRYEITGHITIPDMDRESGSTEQMVQCGRYVYCTCWSYQNRVIKIDTETDMVVAQAEVGLQPKSIVLDRTNGLWVMTDGGYRGNVAGHEAASICLLDTTDMSVRRRIRFPIDDSPADLNINAAGDTLYWINTDVWRMGINDTSLPDTPVIKSEGTRLYRLTVSPDDNDIYVADAIDYQQPGIIYRYTSGGVLTDKFRTGVTPSAFCWK